MEKTFNKVRESIYKDERLCSPSFCHVDGRSVLKRNCVKSVVHLLPRCSKIMLTLTLVEESRVDLYAFRVLITIYYNIYTYKCENSMDRKQFK